MQLPIYITKSEVRFREMERYHGIVVSCPHVNHLHFRSEICFQFLTLIIIKQPEADLLPVLGLQLQVSNGHPCIQRQPWFAILRSSEQDQISCVPVTNDADAKYVTVRWIATIELVPNVASQVTPTIA